MKNWFKKTKFQEKGGGGRRGGIWFLRRSRQGPRHWWELGGAERGRLKNSVLFPYAFILSNSLRYPSLYNYDTEKRIVNVAVVCFSEQSELTASIFPHSVRFLKKANAAFSIFISLTWSWNERCDKGQPGSFPRSHRSRGDKVARFCFTSFRCERTIFWF